MKATALALTAFGILLVTGCAAPKSAFVPPRGILFTQFKAPLMLEYSGDAAGNQTGQADAKYFHDILLTGLNFAWDDCSLNTAARNGNFTKIGTVDYEFLSVLGIFAKTTVHAHQAP